MRLCGWDFITAYSAVSVMISKPSPSASRVDSMTNRMTLKMSLSDDQLSTKKVREPSACIELEQNHISAS